MIERGNKIGRFVIVTELGRGGMGAVYAAHDPNLDRQVALKVLRDASNDEEDRVRMMREGQAMARVTHPNVITVYEVGIEDTTVFLAQELLDGGTLRAWLDKPHGRDAVLDKLLAAGRGLAAAHGAGLVHRDFKPENVLLGKDGRVRVADFGLARAATPLVELETTKRGGGPHRDTEAAVTGDSNPMSPLTRTGAVMGTPMFMAPEQHRGEIADARSDQFAFCVSLYHALYKTWPYEGKTAPALADAVIAGRLAPAPKTADVPAALRKIMLRGLATDPAQRYPSMDALLAELEQAVQPPAKSRGPWLAVAAVVVVGAGAAGAYAVISARADREASDKMPLVIALGDGGVGTANMGVAWLSTAIDRGQLDDAIEKYDLAVKLELQGSQPAAAAIAQASGAYVRVLRGDLGDADKALQDATKHAGSDPAAMAYVDLAAAALAEARAQLPVARDRSRACASYFETTAPVLSALCYQLHGEALAALGANAGARTVLGKGLALATQNASAERMSTLQLVLAQLDLDEQQTERAAQTATEVQTACDNRGAIGCEVRARILLARIRLGQGTAQGALELLTAVKPAQIQMYGVRIAHMIALGEVTGYTNELLDDNVAGLDRIENARAQAEVRGFISVMLEAKLARLRVLLVHDHPEASAEHAALVKQARAAQLERIAQLADAAFKELSGPPRAMLPADGGLPAVRTGSSGPP